MNREEWQRIKTIAIAALDLPADERAAYVARACGADETVRREVEALLQSSDAAADLYEKPVVRLTGVAEVLDDARSTPAAVAGTTIGPYRVVREIGRGGMGSVFLAERADAEFEQRVAIKFVGSIASETLLRRFRAERRILAGLDHPNIARLLDGGTSRDGLPYVIMEYVEGVPIDTYCDGHDLAVRARIDLFQRVCDAVEHAHQRHVIHRDIKPHNILVTASGTPKLLDFGIAKIVDAGDNPPRPETMVRALTPDSASPEQVRGDAMTTASDVYALGVLLFRLLTGCGPYGEPATEAALMRAICEDMPEAPSAVLRRRGDDGAMKSIGRDLDRIVLKALRKEPTERYRSVRELSEDLERCVQGRPVLAVPDSRRYRARKFAQRHRTALATAVAACAAGLVGVVATFVVLSRPAETTAPIRTVAVLPIRSVDAGDDQSLGLKLTDALVQRLGRLRELVVRPTRAVQRYEAATPDPLAAGREQQVDAVLHGSVRQTGPRLRLTVELRRVRDGRQLWANVYDESAADPFFLETIAAQAAQALRPQLTGAERQLVARRDSENVDANRLYTDARYYWNKRNVEGIRQSVALLEDALALDPQYARAHAALADSYIALRDYALLPASAALPRAFDEAQKALAIDDSLAEAHTALAVIQATYKWDWAGADHAFQRAIEQNPNYATAHQSYAEFLTGQGRHREALEHIRLAQQLDPLSLIIYAIEALNLNYARDYDGAIAQSQRVISRDPTFGEVYAYLGFAYEQKGMFREALDAYQTYSTLMGYNTPAAAAIRASSVSDARDYWTKMIELEKLPTGSQTRTAQALAQLGETDKALALLEQASARRSYGILYLKVHPNYDPLRSDPRFNELLRRVGFSP